MLIAFCMMIFGFNSYDCCFFGTLFCEGLSPFLGCILLINGNIIAIANEACICLKYQLLISIQLEKFKVNRKSKTKFKFAYCPILNYKRTLRNVCFLQG